MELQNCERKTAQIRQAFDKKLASDPSMKKRALHLSWSNWGFGIESLQTTAKRLQANDIKWIELHGNRYGPDLGYNSRDTMSILGDHGIRVSGVCGMFSAANDLSSNSGVARQHAIDYIRRQLDLCREVGGSYLLTVPGAVGRPTSYDNSEFHRSAETLRIVADEYVKAGVRCAVEPIRSAEVSFCHTVADAISYIETVDHPGVQHINGDVYHMLTEESHIGEAILRAGERLTNLHVADSNRCALGDGSLDLDGLIMALYVIGYSRDGCFVTPEPLGPGGDPYPAMFGKPDPEALDELVRQTAEYFRTREQGLLKGTH